MSNQWRVFTAEPTQEGYAVVSTLWNDNGPVAKSRAQTVELLSGEGYELADAEKLAAETQRQYDSVRSLYAGTA
jgi:hypothetical protein